MQHTASSVFIPNNILRYHHEENIGRFSFIENQTYITNKKILAAFSHGTPLLNMGTNYDVFPGEGYTNTIDFLNRAGIIRGNQPTSPTLFISGSLPEAIQVTPTWLHQQHALNGIIETDINFLWGRIEDFGALTCIVKTADCLAGLGIGKAADGSTYFLFFHAGWKQINGNIIRKGLQQMKQQGCHLTTFSISIGPSISARALVFQTKDAKTLLDSTIWKEGISSPADEIDDLTGQLTSFVHVNVGQTAVTHMIEEGILPEHIEWYNPNTNPIFDTFHSAMTTPPLLFSHRSFKRGKRNGRNITVLSIQSE